MVPCRFKDVFRIFLFTVLSSPPSWRFIININWNRCLLGVYAIGHTNFSMNVMKYKEEINDRIWLRIAETVWQCIVPTAKMASESKMLSHRHRHIAHMPVCTISTVKISCGYTTNTQVQSSLIVVYLLRPLCNPIWHIFGFCAWIERFIVHIRVVSLITHFTKWITNRCMHIAHLCKLLLC